MKLSSGCSAKILLGLCCYLLATTGCSNKTTSSKPPNAPTNITGRALSSSSLIISWSDNSNDETGFQIYRKSNHDWRQIITIPANQISFRDSLLEDTTVYNYRVTAKNNAGESAPSDSISLTTFSIGHPPQLPSNPFPANDTAGIPIHTSLYWVCSDPDGDSIKFDIFFGSGAYLELIDSNDVDNNFDISNLAYNTVYAWKVQAKDNHHHITIGPIWHFQTRPNSSPFVPFQPVPSNDSNGVDTSLSLNWNCVDPDNDTLSYDVYFGQGSDLIPVAIDIRNNSYNPGRLQYGTQYSWRITARDSYDNETRGPLWSFVTRDSIYTLTTLLQGMGHITILPDRPNYIYGDSVLLTATPDSDWTFSGWSGDISEISNPLNLIITRNLTIIANFSEGHPTTATVAGTINWPGHALSSHTYFFADTLVGTTIYLVEATTVNQNTGNFNLTLHNMSGPLHLLFEAQDDVNNSGPWNPIDMGDGWGFYDNNGDGRWGIGDTMTVAPGAHINGINITLQLMSADDLPLKNFYKY